MALIATLLGGVVVGVIVLYIEYRYFQRKKPAENTTEIIQHKDVSPLWVDAVNSAVATLCKREGVKLEAIPTMKIENNLALVTVRTWANGGWRFYDLKIDKNSDILEINTR
jgi:uncharacterized membrane-anchored protein